MKFRSWTPSLFLQFVAEHRKPANQKQGLTNQHCPDMNFHLIVN
jgi:hypothetical protein